MGALETIRDTRSPVAIRAANVLLGAWLFASAFAWHHQDNVGFNDWGCGVLVAASALCAIWAPPLRWVSAGLAVWLGFSALVFGYASAPTRLHDLALAGAILIVSVIRGRSSAAGEEQVPSWS
jgi:hypothetical protein